MIVDSENLDFLHLQLNVAFFKGSPLLTHFRHKAQSSDEQRKEHKLSRSEFTKKADRAVSEDDQGSSHMKSIKCEKYFHMIPLSISF